MLDTGTAEETGAFGRSPSRRQFDGAVDRLRANDGRFDVFGIASLIRRPEPGMKPIGPAIATSYAKTFSMVDRVHRGVPEAPGRTLGLVNSPAAIATGVIFRVDGVEAMERLYAREAAVDYTAIIAEVYDPATLQRSRALTFVASPLSPDFRNESLVERAEVIASAQGRAGSNLDYFKDVMRVEEELGLGVSTEVARLSTLLA